jgi:hypothetical protein
MYMSRHVYSWYCIEDITFACKLYIYITGVCKIRFLSYKSLEIILNTWIFQLIKEGKNAEVNITYIKKIHVGTY